MAKRIVYLNPIGGLGGAERVLLNLLAVLKQSTPEYDLHLIVCGEGPLKGEAERLGVPTLLLPMPDALNQLGDFAQIGRSLPRKALSLLPKALPAGRALRAYSRTLRSELQMLQPGLIHSNGLKTHVLARMAAPASVPILWHLHDFLSGRGVSTRLLRWCTRGVRAGLAVSRAASDDARQALPGLPMEVLPNGIDLEAFAPCQEAAHSSCSLEDLAGLPPATGETLRIGLVATYARWKGQDIFIKAAGMLAREHPDLPVSWFLVGDPIYQTSGSQFSRAELLALAQEAGMKGRIGFIGFQRETAKIYRALNIVVHASVRPETFGLTIAEAMACGRPVIAAQAGGAAELFTHEVDALGVPPGDAEALAKAIARLAGDAALRARLGKQARRTAEERFGRERMGEQLREIYGRIMER